MAEPFSIDVSHYSAASRSDAELRDEIRTHTDCDEETASIMRSIAHFGDDPSIWRFDMTPLRHRSHAFVSRVAWNVHAVRE